VKIFKERREKLPMSKKIVLRVFLIGEIVFFVTMYLVSPDGLTALQNRKLENKRLVQLVDVLGEEIKKMEQEVKQWEQNPFYQEKIAREQLQMARPTDEVYYV
jgi:hypothetical protein